MGEHAELLRERTDRLHAVGAGWREQGNEQCCVGQNRERSRRNDLSVRPGMASAPVAGNAADSGNVVDRAPGGKYGRGETEIERGRLEGDRRGRSSSVTNARPRVLGAVSPILIHGWSWACNVRVISRSSWFCCCQRDLSVQARIC